MTTLRHIITCIAIAAHAAAFCQTAQETMAATAADDEWEQLMQELADEAQATDDEEGWEGIIDELNELREHPLDINRATKRQVARLPFLTMAQVDGIMDHIARHGPVRDIGELLLARDVGQREIRWLRLCTTAASHDTIMADAANALPRRVRHDFTTRLDVPLYNRDGWPWARGLAHRWRYAVRWRGWEVGARGEKDAGEPMFTREVPLWDAMGAYATLHDAGRLVAAIVGDYKVSFGSGLIISQGFGFSKMLSPSWHTNTDIRPHRSHDEVNFLRGAAATVDLGKGTHITAFASARRMDATINRDNTTNGVATSGLHRTTSELNHRNTLWSHTAGVHAAWVTRHFDIGATALWQHYDHHLIRGTALYRQIYPQGTHFGNIGIDYSARWQRISLRGETARSFASGGGGWATTNRATWRFDANTQLCVIQRFFSYRYYSPHARAFAENSRVQNESGVCLRADAGRVGPFALAAYLDLFHSPWPRYTMTHASTGFEAYVQASYTPNQRHSIAATYRFKNKERSDVRSHHHHLRATYTWHAAQRWTVTAAALLHRHHTALAADNGGALVARASYATTDSPLTATLTATLFATDTYESRIALHEPTLAQTFGFMQLYGRGQRLAATLRLHPTPRLRLQAKLGATHYSDREAISTGPTRIGSPWKADVQLLVQVLVR
ncbi:MAG: hypothetical protein IJS59_02630 [Bacteroidaceae bacterium]|nr:hypothetical protein [Bacteroidaceae bacterium]